MVIITNRYPRTRPNDLSYQRIRGFLSRKYGNSMIINPLDVLNVYEGDYDVDMSDFYVSHSNTMWSHAARATETMWVQGIEPTEEAVNTNAINFHSDNAGQTQSLGCT